MSDRSQLPGSTDLDDDVHEFGLLLPRGELEGHRPSRASRAFSKLALVGDPVDLHDRAVEFYRQPITRILEIAMVGEDVFCRDAARGPRGLRRAPRIDLALGRHTKAEPGKRFEYLRLGFRRLSRLRFPEKDVVREESQRPRPGDPGIELPQRARGGVSRVLEWLLPFGRKLAVHALEVGDREDRLPPHRQTCGYIRSGKPQRQRSDCPEIRGDVLANPTVAARRAAAEHSFVVHELHREPVVLGLQGVLDGSPHQLALHALAELPQFGLFLNAVERQEWGDVLHLGEGVGDTARDPLGGRVGSCERRILRFQGLQVPKQAIVSGIVDLGIVEHVVAVIVVPDPLGQALVTRFDVGRNERLGSCHFTVTRAATSPDSDTDQSRIRSRRRTSAIFSRR